ncbi:MAG: hypothetical protein ACRC0U_06795 [Vibrio sp.]
MRSLTLILVLLRIIADFLQSNQLAIELAVKCAAFLVNNGIHPRHKQHFCEVVSIYTNDEPHFLNSFSLLSHFPAHTHGI